VVTFTGTLLRLLPPFTKVRIPLICRRDFFRRLPEMHGKEDGTVPATFQIIYMVCSTLNASKRNPDAKRADWMETLSKPTETSRKGFRHQKPQRGALKSLDAHSFHWNTGEEKFRILPALAPLQPPR